jgi:hypothetical protein
MLYCMNLPPKIRYLPENVFFIGITPGPKAPTIQTIAHILAPLVQVLNEFWIGKVLPTFCHPNGLTIRAMILPVIADLEAIRKISGFLGHGATQFCSYCTCTHNEIESLDWLSWKTQDGAAVKRSAKKWQALPTLDKKARMAKKTGIRWTPLHDLPYWDPVKHLVLGFMHNTLEGILQTHLRELWGLGRPKSKAMALASQGRNEDTDTEMLTSESEPEIDSELEDLDDYRSRLRPRPSATPSSSHPSDDEGSDNEEPPDTEIDSEDDADWSDDDSDTATTGSTHTAQPNLMDTGDYSAPEALFNFTPAQIQRIHDCLRDISLPSHVNRPPIDLGEASHGKLKANEYLILFCIIFPTILPEFWADTTNQPNNFFLDSSYQGRMLHNFYHLVASTNIVSSFSTSDAEADEYHLHYLEYRRSVSSLFSNFHSKPNHHYAMHNAEQLKFWGPLAALSEFPGERLNGMFQKIKTNRRMCMFFYAFNS